MTNNTELEYGASRQALQDHTDGKLVASYSTDATGEIWESAAYNEPLQEIISNGVDVIDGEVENYMLAVETEDARHVDAEVDNLNLEEVFEYQLSVSVFDREGEKVMKGEPTILSGTATEVDPANWVSHAYESAISDSEVDVFSGNGASSGDLDYLLDEEEKTGLDAVDSI